MVFTSILSFVHLKLLVEHTSSLYTTHGCGIGGCLRKPMHKKVVLTKTVTKKIHTYIFVTTITNLYTQKKNNAHNNIFYILKQTVQTYTIC